MNTPPCPRCAAALQARGTAWQCMRCGWPQPATPPPMPGFGPVPDYPPLPHALYPAGYPPPPAGWAAAGLGFIPVATPIEPDPFWEGRAVPRLWRIPGQVFFGRPAPTPRPPALEWTTRNPSRFAAMVAACGFFGALLYQLTGLGYALVPAIAGLVSPILQAVVTIFVGLFALLQGLSLVQQFLAILALGAPLFEELLKVGVALLICLPLAGARNGPLGARLGLYVVRFVAAAGVGLLFGYSEHFLYAGEGQAEFLARMTFHSAAAALSMTMYDILERADDARAVWLLTTPSSFLHYANNGFGPFIAVFLGGQAAELWSLSVVILLLVSVVVAPLLSLRLRRVAVAALQRRVGVPGRLARDPELVDWPLAPRRQAGPSPRAP